MPPRGKKLTVERGSILVLRVIVNNIRYSIKSSLSRKNIKLGVVVLAWNLSTQEAEGRGSQVQGPFGVHGKTVSNLMVPKKKRKIY